MKYRIIAKQDSTDRPYFVKYYRLSLIDEKGEQINGMDTDIDANIQDKINVLLKRNALSLEDAEIIKYGF